ncbi:MAG: PP-loop family protein [Desulfovibrio sp.]|nr:PP-loop family protein [Desulfovibrio sp.]
MCTNAVVATVVPKLWEWLKAHKKLALAFSGGLDSRVLAALMQEAGCDVVLLTVTGPHIAAEDTQWAHEQANKLGLPLRSTTLDVHQLPKITSRERCYVCKKAMLNTLRTLLTPEDSNRIVCDGTNIDDSKGYRPGRKALIEELVYSPLALSQIGKKRIRELAQLLHLDNPTQTPSPCLLTRFAYDLQPDPLLFPHITPVEKALADLLTPFWPNPLVRLRFLPEPLLQIPEHPMFLRPSITAILATHNLLPCRLLCTDTVSGFFDQTLPDCATLPLLQ